MYQKTNVVNKIYQNVNEKLKPFNDNLLKQQRKNQIDSCISFLDIVYRESVKLFNGNIRYIGCQILSPEETFKYETSDQLKFTFYNIKKSNWNLVRFNFEFVYKEKEPTPFNVHLYLPYLINDFIMIANTNYGIQGSLTDKVFSKNGETIVVKLLKSPIDFLTKLYTITSVSKNLYQIELPIVKAHHNSRKVKRYTTIFHYFVCKFGLEQALAIFNLKSDDVRIIDNTKTFNPDYEYFVIEKRKFPKYLMVRKILLFNIKVKSIVGSLIKILSVFKYLDPVEQLYNEPEAWYIFLGRTLYGPKLEKAKAHNHIKKHIESLDTYLDPISKKRFESFGLTNINTIYDLFKFMLDNINEINIKYSKSDLLLKRIDYFDQILIDIIIKPLTYKIYRQKSRNQKFKYADTIRTFKLKIDIIKDMYNIQNVSTSINSYNNLKLFNYLSKIIKPSAKNISGKKSKDSIGSLDNLQYNLSEILVFSPFCSSTSNPLNSSSVNPFSEINEFGGIISTKFYETFLAKGYDKYFK